MNDIDSVPVEVHIACIVIAGLIDSVAYGVDWNKVF
jgi:hypothetical protein